MLLLKLFLLFVLADMALALYIAFTVGKRSNSMYAKFTPGAIISEIRNKIAATVFSKNGAGAIIRNRITPINRRTTLQTNQDRKSTRLNSSHTDISRMPSSA